MSRKPRIIQIGWTRGKPSRKGDRPIEFLKFRVFIFFYFLLRMDCSLGANGNGAESFKKTSEINFFATDEHGWDTLSGGGSRTASFPKKKATTHNHPKSQRFETSAAQRDIAWLAAERFTFSITKINRAGLTGAFHLALGLPHRQPSAKIDGGSR
jgi:hypothetical protein